MSPLMWSDVAMIKDFQNVVDYYRIYFLKEMEVFEKIMLDFIDFARFYTVWFRNKPKLLNTVFFDDE